MLPMRSIFISPVGCFMDAQKFWPRIPRVRISLATFEMTYKDHPINCEDFPWYSRVFTKPHIEIENDPRVWAEAASLIDLSCQVRTSTADGVICLQVTLRQCENSIMQRSCANDTEPAGCRYCSPGERCGPADAGDEYAHLQTATEHSDHDPPQDDCGGQT